MSKERIAIFLVIIFHLVGAVGLSSPTWQPVFLKLVPFHLLLMLTLTAMTAYDRSPGLYVFTSLVFLGGFLVEVIGVNTGWIFGKYTYGETLGLKLWNTPLLIGVNWLILVYSVGVFLDRFNLGPIAFALCGSVIMIVLDFMIEPVAIRSDYWTWEGGQIPLQNYMGWFLVSFLFFVLFSSLHFRKQNPLGFVMVLAQFAFFLVLNTFVS